METVNLLLYSKNSKNKLPQEKINNKQTQRHLLGVGGMSEGFQILLLDILFQRSLRTIQIFGKKTKFHHFWWLAPGNSKKLLFCQHIGENQNLEGYNEI